jgi:hypothetical protein
MYERKYIIGTRKWILFHIKHNLYPWSSGFTPFSENSLIRLSFKMKLIFLGGQEYTEFSISLNRLSLR